MTKQTTWRGCLVIALLLLPASSFAQYASPANSYSLERWDEDYSYLKDPAARSDFFDPIKYIPFGPADSYLSLGGQARYRYDYFNNPTFGPGTNDEDGFHLQRYLLHADAHLTQNFRAFVQVDHSLVDGRTGGGRVGDSDTFDLQQGFIDIKTSDAADPYAYLRVGRQELIYGAQRLVSPDDWRNVRRSFDGVKGSISIPNDTIDFFWTRPVLIERDQFNNDDPGTNFSGVYNVLALPDFLPHADSKFETYFFALNQTRTSTAHADVDTYTLGGRFYTNPRPIDFDVEGAWQFGDFESNRIDAWFFATEAGYTFSDYCFTPRFSVGLDIASGSPGPSNRFNQLFPPTYMYLGHLYLFGRPNLIDAHVGLVFHLTEKLALFTAQHIFWRENANDALYNLSGAVVRADNGSGASYVGNEFDIAITYQFTRHTSGYLGFATFLPGDFINQTGASENVSFLYASLTYTF
jgi:hypothetical protein